jgi:hypothetical protein
VNIQSRKFRTSNPKCVIDAFIGERWHGKNVTEAEVAIFYEGKVWSSQSLPDGKVQCSITGFRVIQLVRFGRKQVVSGGVRMKSGADSEGRTRDLAITNRTLYQLS